MKKLLCLMLTLILVLSLSAPAFATGFGGLLSNVQQNYQSPQTEKLSVEQLDAQQILEEAAGGKKLTIMVYMCGSNLESAPQSSATRDIQEMMASGFSAEDINLVIMPGGAKKWHIANINRDQTGIYSVRPEGITELWLAGNRLNMGDPETLAAFLDYSYKTFPAEKFILIIWDHGGGSIGGVCHDENTDDMLSMLELKSAFEKSPFAGRKLDLLGFDACLMASAEVSVMMAPYACYMVASEETEPGYGWDYAFLKDIGKENDVAEIGSRIVSTYLDFYNSNYSGSKVTLSCISLSAVIGLAEGIDGFFAEAAEHIREEDSAEVSKAVRKVPSFGNANENPRTGAFDLLDLGELVLSLESYVPSGGDRLLKLLNNEVVMKSGTNMAVPLSGLSLYHPLNEKRNYTAYISAYKEFGILPGYVRYIENFGRMLMSTPVTSFSGLLANFTDGGKVQRLLISLPLNEEQRNALAEAQLIVLQQAASGDDAYHLVSVSDNVVLDAQGALQGEFVFRNLFITDSEGTVIPGTAPLYYSLDNDGKILVPVTLCGSDPETGEAFESSAYLVCEENEKGFVNAVSVLAFDEVTETYTARFQPDPASVQKIRFDCVDRVLTRGEDDAVYSFDDWDIVGVTEFYWSAEDPYSLRFLENSLEENSLYITFLLTDIQSNRYSSELFSLAGEEKDVLYLMYDDKDQLIVLAGPSCSMLEGFGLQLAFEVTNISDREVLVTLSGLKAAEKELKTEAAVYGMGAHDGLLPGEAQTLFLIAPAEWPDGLTAIEAVEFSLTVSDAETGEKLAVIPVKGSGHIAIE